MDELPMLTVIQVCEAWYKHHFMACLLEGAGIDKQQYLCMMFMGKS
jgi:hypothetical protein